MLTIRIKRTALEQIEDQCRAARSHETGGMLFGEHVGENEFRIVEATISDAGDPARFQRSLEPALTRLDEFFDETSRAYQRFNYLGEWHSHPSFSLVPSDVDDRTMFGIVADEAVGARFAVSLIVRLQRDEITARAWAYFPNRERSECKVVLEPTTSTS